MNFQFLVYKTNVLYLNYKNLLQVWLFFFYFLFILGFEFFLLSVSIFLSALLSLEFMVLSLFFLFFFFLGVSSLYFSLIYLTFAACEGALGLSILVIMSRTHGGDYFKSFNFI